MYRILFGIKIYLFRLTNKFRICSITDKHRRYCRQAINLGTFILYDKNQDKSFQLVKIYL